MRRPRLRILLLCIALCACGATSSRIPGDWPSAVGAPQATHRHLRRLVNDGFTIGYDERRSRAAWVAYRVTPVTGFTRMPRPRFTSDPRLAQAAPTGIYAGARYDRGHLAPNYAIAQLYGEAAQRETFYYSNIAPQRQRLNQLVWQRLEEIEVDDIAPRVDPLWVVLGPIPAADGGPPQAFFRIWLAHRETGSWQAMAFRVPQGVRGDERLDRFLVSVDAVEAATGLDFFTGLDRATESALEAEPARDATFDLRQFVCLPARYGKRWQHRDGIRLRYDRCGSPLFSGGVDSTGGSG